MPNQKKIGRKELLHKVVELAALTSFPVEERLGYFNRTQLLELVHYLEKVNRRINRIISGEHTTHAIQ